MPRKGKKPVSRSIAASGSVGRVEVSGPIDRREAEALRLAIRRLAARHRIRIGEVRVERRRTSARRRRP
jgi:hypothetical protein